MDKNSILEAARRNNERGMEFEFNESVKASLVTIATTIIIGMLLFIVDLLLKKVINMSLIIVGVSMIAADMLYRGITFNKLWRIIVGVFLSLVAILMIVIRMVI